MIVRALLLGFLLTAAPLRPALSQALSQSPARPAPGRYLVTLRLPEAGEFQLLLTFAPGQPDSLLTGYSTPQVPGRLAGGVAALALKGQFHGDGSLARLNWRPAGSARPSRLGVALQGTFDFVPAAPVPGGGFGGELRHVRTQRRVGQLAAVPAPAGPAAPIRSDYPALTQQLLELAESKLYNPAVVQAKPWREYRRYLLDKASQFQDDGDLLFASAFKARTLPFSHFYLMGNKAVPVAPAVSTVAAPAVPAVPAVPADAPGPGPSLSEPAPGVALLTVPAFDIRAAVIDSLMQLVLRRQPRALILDLRANSGGDMEGGMRLLQYLAAAPLNGGTMVARRWWSQHPQPPTPAEAAQLPVMSRASYAFFRDKRGEVDGLTLRVEPLGPRYAGRVFVLTSAKTASAAEPVVYGIQYYKLGQVVGAPTAGMVLSMEELPLDRYTFQLPMMDYYTPDGRRLDQVGVRPDHAVAPAQALEYVLTRLLP